VSVAKARVRVLPHRVDKQVEGVARQDGRCLSTMSVSDFVVRSRDPVSSSVISIEVVDDSFSTPQTCVSESSPLGKHLGSWIGTSGYT